MRKIALAALAAVTLAACKADAAMVGYANISKGQPAASIKFYFGSEKDQYCSTPNGKKARVHLEGASSGWILAWGCWINDENGDYWVEINRSDFGLSGVIKIDKKHVQLTR